MYIRMKLAMEFINDTIAPCQCMFNKVTYNFLPVLSCYKNKADRINKKNKLS